MKSKRTLKKSVSNRHTLKKIIRSGKLFKPECFSRVASAIAMKLQKTQEYLFVLAMHSFHQRQQNLLLAAQFLRDTRKAKNVRAI